MSIAAIAVAEVAIAQISVSARGARGTPRRRRIKAVRDTITPPEAR